MSDDYDKIYSSLVKQAFGLKDDNKGINELKNEISKFEANTATIIKRLVDYIEEQGDKINEWKKSFSQDYKKDVNELIDKRINNINGQNLSQEQISYIKRLIDEKINIIPVEVEDLYTSKMRIEDDKTVSKLFRFIDTKGIGEIEQILFVAQTSNFTLYIEIDNNILFNKPYSYFETYSDFLADLRAYLSAGKYYVSIKQIKFLNDFHIHIHSDSQTIFDHISIKYAIRDEKLL